MVAVNAVHACYLDPGWRVLPCASVSSPPWSLLLIPGALPGANCRQWPSRPKNTRAMLSRVARRCQSVTCGGVGGGAGGREAGDREGRRVQGGKGEGEEGVEGISGGIGVCSQEQWAGKGGWSFSNVVLPHPKARHATTHPHAFPQHM